MALADSKDELLLTRIKHGHNSIILEVIAVEAGQTYFGNELKANGGRGGGKCNG